MNEAPIVKVEKLALDAQLPEYASAGAACFDLRAILEHPDHFTVVTHSLPGTFRTGLAFEIPPGYAMIIYSRSGHGFNDDTRLANCVGVIDSDYRGEVKVKLTIDNPHVRLTVRHGDRIAQAKIVAAPQVKLVMVADLSETARGRNGFGSTGAA